MFDLDDDTRDTPRADETTKDDRPGKPVEVGRLFRALLRRRWWLVAAAILAIVAGAVVAKTLVPRTYAAQTVMVWEAGEEGMPDVRELRTLVDSVKLPTNLAAVRERVGAQATLDRLAARLDVRFDRDSNLVTVRAEDDDPEGAVELADTAVEVFLGHQRGVEEARLEDAVETIEADVAKAEERLENAQERYDGFRQQHGVADLAIERQQAIELAASLRAQADIAQADAVASSARGAVARSATPEREQMSPQLREARQRLDAARARLSEDHPRVQTLLAEVRALAASESERRQPSSAGHAAASAAAQRAAAERRQEVYEELQTQARRRLEELSAVEGQASSLLAAVRVAEAHLADLQGAAARARDAARSPSAGFRVVAPALLPEEPERSYRKPVAIALPLGLMLVVLLGFLGKELWGLRVHTANEAAYWGRAAVIASTTWPRESAPLAAVVDELAEQADRAGGTTLILGATEADQEIADRIASHLRVQVSVHATATDATYYDPEADVAVITPPEKRSELALVQGGHGGGSGPHHLPALAKKVDTTMARRRGSRLEQVKVSKSEYLLDEADREPASITVWSGDEGEAYLRRASRMSDRVVLVLRSGALSAARVSELRGLVGRRDGGVAFLLVDVPPHLATLSDRAGPVEQFWRTFRP